ncbi:MAG TPA: BatA domain-containing protein [Candidatus Nanoarchaeia archaeon]|nr:BatA domain-containing protein [Candidatus Nanoarchaeia archaeon]
MAIIPEIFFSNTLGLLGLASVIPLIILYLLRPKTIDLKVPSLLFFLKREQQRNKLSLLLRKLIRDPLFLIQLLVLILLSLCIAGPYIADELASSQHTVIVIDNSASMQAGGRLDKAKELAVQNLSNINSVVWAQNVPILAIHEVDLSSTKRIIELTPQRAVASDLAAAITYGQRLVGPGGVIIVYSDFASWTGDDPQVAKTLAEYDGIEVKFVQVGEVSDNIGITNGWLDVKDGKNNLNLIIKNFNNKAEKVTLNINTGGTSRGGSLSVPADQSAAYIVTNIGSRITEVSIDNGGALAIDDTAYISVLTGSGGRVLMVDNRDQNPTQTALDLLSVRVEYSSTIPSDLSPYGIIILGDINNNTLGPGFSDSLSGFVDNGGVLIVSANQGLISLNGLNSLLPISITGFSNETDLSLVSENPLTKNLPLTDVEVVLHIKGIAADGSTVLIEASDGSPMLSYLRQGEGTVVYLGLNDITGDDAWSGFNTLPEFPLFWKNMFDWLGGTNLDEHNVKTGTMLRLPSKQAVINPDGTTITTTNLWIDQAGIYNIGGQMIASNLYNAKESNIGEISLDASSIGSKLIERPVTLSSEGKKDISAYLIWVVLGLILLELIIIQRRRELF